jgi:hypothetical protein
MMFPLSELLPLIVQSFFSIIVNPFFWIFIAVVINLYRKMGAASRYLFATPGDSLRRVVLLAILSGIGGGFIGSLLLVFVGVSVNELGGLSLFFTALVLMLIQQRFLCFAYAGGVLSVLHLVFGFPQGFSVAQVMALVAVLHLIEALLIYLTGSIYPFPVYVSNQKGQVVGGFNLQKFWPLPLVVFFAGLYPDPEVLKGLIDMPDWWPLIKAGFSGAGDGNEVVYSMLAVPAVLGYGDIATTTTPREKTRRAAGELAGFSVILLLLAIAAGHVKVFAYAAALFGPLGHEALIHLERRRERGEQPLYVAVEDGLKLLHVWAGSPLAKAQVRSGDLLLAVNGQAVHDERELREALAVGVKTMRRDGKIVAQHDLLYFAAADGVKKAATVACREGEALGHVPVPAWDASRFLYAATSHSLLKKWWRKITKRRKK